MRKIIGYICLFLVSIQFLTAQNKSNSFTWPKSPASKVFQDFIKAYNSKEEKKVKNFISKHYDNKSIQNIDDKIEFWMDLHYRYGPVTAHSLSINKPYDLEVWLKGDITKTWFAPEFILDKESHKIKAIGILQGEQPSGVILHSENENQFISKLERYIKENEKHGLFQGNVLILKNKKVLINKAYGYSNFEHQVKNNSNTRMRISSITKSITVIACLQLIQKGYLNLEISISKYLPELPSHISNKITLKSLINHTSGYELDGIEGFRSELKKTKSIDEVFKLHLKYLPKWKNYTDFNPSKKFDYSNDSFDLIAKIIEKVTGLKFETYLNNYVFKVANMSSTSFEKHNLATPYRYDIKEKKLVNYENKYPYSIGGISGAGGLKSTTSDLANLFNTLYNTNKLLDFPNKSLMFSISQSTNSASNPDAGNSPLNNLNFSNKKRVKNGRSLGFDVSYDVQLNIGHSGVNIGNSAELRYFPNSEYLMIVLCNNRSGAQNFYNYFKNHIPKN